MRFRRLLTSTLLAAAACAPVAVSPERDVPPIPVVEATAFPASAGDAARAALTALEAAPEDARTNGRLGMLLHAYARLEPAADCYRRAMAFDPEQPRWPYLLGVTLADSGDAEEAVAVFRQALSLRDQAAGRIRLAEALLSAGQADESRQAFEDALRLNPRAAAAFYGLGRVLVQAGEQEDGLRLLRKAVELAPDSGSARYALGLALRDLGEADESATMLASADALNRSLPPLDDPVMREVEALRRDEHWLLNEGKRAEETGDIEGAIGLYLEAVALAPDFGPAEANLVGAYGKLGRMEEAERHYRRAIEVAPDAEEPHNNWGVIQARRGNSAGAIQSFRRALEINPYSVDANFNLAVALAGGGSAADAVKLLERTLELQPNHRLAHFHLGRLLALGGRVDDGIRHLRAAAEGRPDSMTPSVLYALGVAYANAERTQEAEESLTRAIEAAQSSGQVELATSIRESLRDLAAQARP